MEDKSFGFRIFSIIFFMLIIYDSYIKYKYKTPICREDYNILELIQGTLFLIIIWGMGYYSNKKK